MNRRRRGQISDDLHFEDKLWRPGGVLVKVGKGGAIGGAAPKRVAARGRMIGVAGAVAADDTHLDAVMPNIQRSSER